MSSDTSSLESLSSTPSVEQQPKKATHPYTTDKHVSDDDDNDEEDSQRQPQAITGESPLSSVSNLSLETDTSSRTGPVRATASKSIESKHAEQSQNPDDYVKVFGIRMERNQIVPKSKRRGILAQLCLIPEYEDARRLPHRMRSFFTFIIAYIAMIGPMGTSILFPATDNAVANLHTTVTIFNVAVGIYLVTLGVVPLWWSNFSERWGRRSIYIVSFVLYVGFTIGCALSKNATQLIIFRVFSGGCAASVQAVGAGTVTDMYAITERGTAMGVFYLGPLAGPLVAPIAGGAITSNKSFGWRATQWFLIILAVVAIIVVIFLLPETLRRQESREAIRKLLRERRSQRPKEEQGSSEEKQSLQSSSRIPEDLESQLGATGSDANVHDENVKLDRIVSRFSMAPSLVNEEASPDEDDESEPNPIAPLTKVRTQVSFKRTKTKAERLEEQVTRVEQVERGGFWTKAAYYFKIYGWGPLKAFVFLEYPPISVSIAYSAPCFAALYVLNMSLTYCYSRPPYNFGPMLVGLVYIPNSVAYFIASIYGGKFNDYLLKRKIKKYGVVAPEARFGINVFSAAIVLPISLLIAGWCLDKGEHWVTPLIGTALFGFAQMIDIGITITYLADCLPGRGATGVAINNFIRQLMAAGVTFATAPLIKAIGVGPLFSICAGITACLIVLLIVIVKRGDHWRETYDLERLYDIVDS